MNTLYRFLLFFQVLAFALAIFPGPQSLLAAGHGIDRWLGQTVYVPLYSHIYADERFRNKPFNLTATLSIRNTDPKNSLRLQSVDYYDSSGRKLRGYLEKPLVIAPLGSTRYVIKDTDTSGGSGAKFLVTWSADSGITEPIIESIMIGTQMQQGISFVSRGKVIDGNKQ